MNEKHYFYIIVIVMISAIFVSTYLNLQETSQDTQYFNSYNEKPKELIIISEVSGMDDCSLAVDIDTNIVYWVHDKNYVTFTEGLHICRMDNNEV